MFKTMQQLITDVENAVYQSAGPAVQTYSQDLIMQMIQDGFDAVFTKRWWPQFRIRETLVLDGVTGRTTSPPVSIVSYEDIRYAYHSFSERPLPVLPMAINTLREGFDSGDTPRYIEGDANTVFRVWPSAASGPILIVGRKRPTPYLITDTVLMDATLLKHFAAWAYFADDGSSPAATEKHRGLFETRLMQLEKDNFNEPIELDPATSRNNNQWSERW